MKLRTLAYSLLTQAIIVLAHLRDAVVPPWWSRGSGKRGAMWDFRLDRTYYLANDTGFICCDCGLVHGARPLPGEKPQRPAFRVYPIRPVGYTYRLRIGATSSSFVDESTA